MQQKLVASELFNNKKESYSLSVPVPFSSNRLEENESFQSIAKAKQDFFKDKRYTKDSNEKEIVNILNNMYKYIIVCLN